MAEPEIQPNSMLPAILVCASAPGTRPEISLAKFTSRIAIPPEFIITPDRMKNGTASSEKLSRLASIFCAEVNSAMSKGAISITAAKAAATMATASGIPRKAKIPNTLIRIRLACAAMGQSPASAARSKASGTTRRWRKRSIRFSKL